MSPKFDIFYANGLDSEPPFMRVAISLAKRSLLHGDVPVGAVIVLKNEIIGRGWNRRVQDQDPLAHAEIVALRDAAKTLGNWRLDGATMFVTLEPCTMCAGALVQARLSGLVFGASDKKAGAVRSVYQVCDDPRLPHRITVYPPVLASECALLLKKFFSQKRL